MGQPPQPPRTPLWLLPNLLSLDAPLVAVVWQDLLARSTASPLRWPARLVLGLTVWAIYLADRLLDVRRPAVGPESARHSFYRRHRRGAALLLLAVVSADAAVTIFLLRPAVFHTGLFALAGVLSYLAVVHLGLGWRPPKEILVALLFVTGTFLVAWTWDAAEGRPLLLPAAAFFLLCLANLVAIETWEWRELRVEASGRPQPLVLGLGAHLPLWTAALGAACLLFGSSPWFGAVGAAAALTAALTLVGRRLPLTVRRVLIDAVLLTPLFFGRQ